MYIKDSRNAPKQQKNCNASPGTASMFTGCYSDSTLQINNLKAPSANLLALVACQSLGKANYTISATIEKPLENK